MDILGKKINSDLYNTALNQLWRLISGPLLLIFIPLYLNAEEQGYWFSFISLAALAILADLGFSTIIMQFSAHEFAYLHFDDQGNLAGDIVHLQKIATLFVFSLKWAMCLAVIAFPIILVAGYVVLSQRGTNVQWEFPWILYVSGSAIAFINATVLCFFEGCNSVSKVQNIRLKISVVMSCLTLLALFLGLTLYSLSLALLGGAFAGIYCIYKKFAVSIISLLKIAFACKYSWKNELLSLIWRYAISWASGYFVFHLYTPLTFFYYGAIEAGRVGISISLCAAVLSLSNVWINAIIPKLNIYVSKREWILLDKLFFDHFVKSLATFLLGFIVVGVIAVLFGEQSLLSGRFVGITSMFLLATSYFIGLIVNGLAVYLRAHKEEPLVKVSLLMALYILVTTFLCAKYLSSEYLFLGYFTSYFIAMPWIIQIFIERRRKHAVAFK